MKKLIQLILLIISIDSISQNYTSYFTDFIYIKSNIELEAAVFDITGKLIMSEYFTAKLDISFLEKGTYILNLTDGINTSSHKIIKD